MGMKFSNSEKIEAKKKAFMSLRGNGKTEMLQKPIEHVPLKELCSCVRVVSTPQEDEMITSFDVKEHFSQLQIDAIDWKFHTWLMGELVKPSRLRMVNSCCTICDGLGVVKPSPHVFLVCEGAMFSAHDGKWHKMIVDKRVVKFHGLQWSDFDSICTAYGVLPEHCERYDPKAYKPRYDGLIVLLPILAGSAPRINYEHIYKG